MYGYFYFTSKDYKTDVLSLCYLDVLISILLIKLLIFKIFLIFIEHLNIKEKIRINFVHIHKQEYKIYSIFLILADICNFYIIFLIIFYLHYLIQSLTVPVHKVYMSLISCKSYTGAARRWQFSHVQAQMKMKHFPLYVYDILI